VRREYVSAVSDNRRWEAFAHRPDDIFVCTPPKCGTTWMQTIVNSLLWPDGNAPGAVTYLAPWLDARFAPIEEIVARLDGQQHRRSIKTHTPADGIPWFDDCRYIYVARDGRDAFMSMCHHAEIFRDDVRANLNAVAAEEGVPPMPTWNGDVHAFFAAWLVRAGFFAHVRSYWDRRDQPNLLFVHYNDLKADLAGEMRRVADFLGIEVSEQAWPEVVDRCTFERMRERDTDIGGFERNFEGGIRAFLFKGTNGRWRDVLTDDELAAYARAVAEELPPEAATWLERGSGT
jgi:aryl sulfotransferase